MYDTASVNTNNTDEVTNDMSSGEHVYDNPTSEGTAQVQNENYDNLGQNDPIDATDPASFADLANNDQ